MRGAPFPQSDFSRGLNTIASPYKIIQGESRDCLNVVGTVRGAVRKRTGSTVFSVSAELKKELTSLASVKVGASTFLIAAGGGKIFAISSAGAVETIKTGMTSDRWSVLQSTESTEAGKPNKKVGGPVWLVNGKDKPLYWTGPGEAKTWVGEEGATYYEDATSKEHVPNGKFMVLAGNRIWMAGMSDDTSAVRFTDFSTLTEGGKQTDPTAWLKENVIRFDKSDDSPITGLGVVGPYVVVFKKRKVWIIYDLNEGSNRRISDNIGCVAHRSIVETPQGTFFLTADQGVYMTNGSVVKEMSNNVRPSFQAANQTKLENAAAGYLNGHYYVSFPTAGSSVLNRTFDYDFQLGSWWLHDLAANQWAAWDLGTEANPLSLYIARANGENVLKTFVSGVYQDAGANYTGANGLSAYWISGWEPFWQYFMRHRFAQPNPKKRVRQIFFDGSGEIVPLVFKNFLAGGTQYPATVNNAPEVTFPVNFQSTQEKWGEGSGVWGEGETVWGGAAETGAARIYAPGIARVWAVGFGNSTAEPFEVDSYAYYVTFRKS